MSFLKRVLVAFFFIPSLLLIFSVGDIALASFIAVIALQMMFELREMFLKKGVIIPRIILVLGLLVLFASMYFGTVILFASLLLTFIVIYIALFISTIYHIRLLDNGSNLVLSLTFIIWITDMSAYFAGKSLGKHKGVFKASPNKSLEGYLAGIFFSFVASFLLIRFFNLSLLQALAVAISGGIFGQLGDLFESLIKRDTKIKDSSDFLPGHGGLLDRFDSFLLAAPVFYVILYFIK